MNINRATKKFPWLATVATLGVITAVQGATLLSPDVLHPLAFWGGAAGNTPGVYGETHLAPLLDGNTGTEWTHLSGNATVMLSSPVPFIPTRVEVNGHNQYPHITAATVEILPLGTTVYSNTGIAVPGGLTASQSWGEDIPLAYQVPVSTLRLNFNFHSGLSEVRFYGTPVGGLIDITSRAVATQTNPGTESPAGALTNGVLEDDTSGYFATSGSNMHTIVADFGSTPQRVMYVATSSNQYWRPPYSAIGTTDPYSYGDLINLGSPVPDTWWTQNGMAGENGPGHNWIIMPVNGGDVLDLYSAGFRSTEYHGSMAEFVIIGVPEPATLSLVALVSAACLLRRRRMHF